MEKPPHDEYLQKALILLVTHCPRLVRSCYWAGTSSIAIEELHHRQSFDLDFHTHKALLDVRPLLAEIQQALPGRFLLIQAPDEFGSGFSGLLAIDEETQVTIEIMSNYEDVSPEDLTPSQTAPPMKRVSLTRYLCDKMQCVAERSEARDLIDIMAALKRFPQIEPQLRKDLQNQDLILLTERLMLWTEEALQEDLEAYEHVELVDAKNCIDLLLQWIRECTHEKNL